MRETKRYDRIAILSLNIFIRPEGIHGGKWLQEGDFKDLRIKLLLKKIEQFDIVILQEMFEVGFRQRRFVKNAYDIGFKYHCGSVWPTLFDSALIDGGLLILSRYPIIQRDRITYEKGLGVDGVCTKGALYAQIVLSPDDKDCIHIFTTHTQAGERLPAYTTREHQLLQLVSFINKQLSSHDCSGNPILVTGDFNLDARHDITHVDNENYLSKLCEESRVYQNFVHQLSVGMDHREIFDLMKVHDLMCRLDGDLHSITNGNGHCTLSHTATIEDCREDGKCIDYIFYSPPKERYGTFLDVISEATMLDLCTTKELVDDVQLPITNLSDHYGLRAVFERTNQYGDQLLEMLHSKYPPEQYAEKTESLWQWKICAILGAVVFIFVLMVMFVCYHIHLLAMPM